jgi:hypothetical protein
MDHTYSTDLEELINIMSSVLLEEYRSSNDKPFTNMYRSLFQQLNRRSYIDTSISNLDINRLGGRLLLIPKFDINFNEKKEERIIIKAITGNNICPILQTEIKVNELYMICSICKCNFIKNTLIVWLNGYENCPHCRSKWDNYNVYKNIAQSNEIITIDDIIKIESVQETQSFKYYHQLQLYIFRPIYMYNNNYMKCCLCRKIFDNISLQQSLRRSNICPWCKKQWIDKTIYISVNCSFNQLINEYNCKYKSIQTPKYAFMLELPRGKYDYKYSRNQRYINMMKISAYDMYGFARNQINI